MDCFSGRLTSAASDQKLFCKLCSPFCCSFNEFVEEKVITRPIPPPSWLLPSTILNKKSEGQIFKNFTKWQNRRFGRLRIKFLLLDKKTEIIKSQFFKLIYSLIPIKSYIICTQHTPLHTHIYTTYVLIGVISINHKTDKHNLLFSANSAHSFLKFIYF